LGADKEKDWIQGHPLGRKFKALVCHDGVFSTLNQWCTEELFFPIHDFEGTLYENREAYEKWDPARFLNEWATPQLVRHIISSNIFGNLPG
jgi:dipeptidyl aminopeptidase/acylaminoacyl peptidase